MRLYHYTCSHGLKGIQRDGYLRPHWNPLLDDLELVWLTDLDLPDRAALGLTSLTLRCDRTEHRIEVGAEVTHWPRFARRFPPEQRRPLELAPGSRPMHWYVTEASVPVLAIAASAS